MKSPANLPRELDQQWNAGETSFWRARRGARALPSPPRFAIKRIEVSLSAIVCSGKIFSFIKWTMRPIRRLFAFCAPARFLSLLPAWAALLVLSASGSVMVGFAGEPAAVTGQQVDYAPLAFYPDRWRDAGVSFEMLAWAGDHVTFLTKPGEYDEELMAAFVSKLDRGWQTQQELVGAAPRLFRHLEGKPTICALPKPHLSCGVGCGYVGATGIEVGKFDTEDWPEFRKNPDSFAHYYFYEMARNFYLFGDRHSLFTTGYAVLMRYACMDELGCEDPDLNTRRTIESCEQIYADSEIRFLDAFTNLTANEKGHRLTDPNGKVISPSDQPVMYAAAMLKLRRDYGGDDWLKKFLHALGTCKEFKADDERSAIPQCLNWLVCASVAAGEDLSPVFVDRWRMPLTKQQRARLEKIDWRDPDLPVAAIVDNVLAP